MADEEIVTFALPRHAHVREVVPAQLNTVHTEHTVRPAELFNDSEYSKGRALNSGAICARTTLSRRKRNFDSSIESENVDA